MLIADLSLFLGRFHPVLVHLPIGFLLLAAILEWWPGQRMQRAARIGWGLGAASAVLAAFLGWLLAGEGSYGEDAIFWHKWLGIGVAVLAVAGFFLTRKNRPVNKAYAGLTALILLLAGHQGGELTHGEDYLFDHAPCFLQSLAGVRQEPVADWSGAEVDSIRLYTDLIAPVIEASCVKCHNAGKQNGGLSMDQGVHLLAGGDNGPILVAGNPLGSEWVRRITLPVSHKKSMPPDGNPLAYTDIELIKHWIETGADTLALLSDAELPAPLQALLLRDYQLDVSPKSFVEKLKVTEVDRASVEQLAEMGWVITRLSDQNGALEVTVYPRREVDGEALRQLTELAGEQVVYLSLESQQLAGHYPLLSNFPHLNRLKLSNSDVRSADLEVLSRLQYLESLNLYATEIGDDAVATLARLKGLRRLYLWQSAVTETGARSLAEQLTDTEINTGFQRSDPTAEAN